MKQGVNRLHVLDLVYFVFSSSIGISHCSCKDVFFKVQNREQTPTFVFCAVRLAVGSVRAWMLGARVTYWFRCLEFSKVRIKRHYNNTHLFSARLPEFRSNPWDDGALLHCFL